MIQKIQLKSILIYDQVTLKQIAKMKACSSNMYFSVHKVDVPKLNKATVQTHLFACYAVGCEPKTDTKKRCV